MSQGMDDKIRQISEMLNSPEAQDGIRNLFSSLGRPRESDTGTGDVETFESGSPMISESLNPHSPNEADWIYHIQNMLSQVNSVQDSRINLLRSVHPFLNTVRRERCSTCLNILKIATILRTMTNSGGGL